MKKSDFFAQKIVVVTGATSGIGLELSKQLKSLGATVVGISRSAEQSETSFCCDIKNKTEVNSTFEKIATKFGKIDILINNAGYGVSGAVELVDDEQTKNIFDVNVLGQIWCSKAVLKHMSKGGRIVNISSACALFPLPFRSLYCSSKSALHMLSMSMDMELSPSGIRVISICPGDTKTNFTKNRVKNFATNIRYGARVENATQKVDGREQKRMDAKVVANKIVGVCASKNPKPFVIVGAKYKLLHFAMRFLPARVLSFFTLKLFGGLKPNS